MIHRLRHLERLLACQRAEVLTEPHAWRFASAWQHALDTGAPLPDHVDLIHAVAKDGVAILAHAPLAHYLDQCRRDRRTPDPARLVETIVHGYAETRLPSRPCRCRAGAI